MLLDKIAFFLELGEVVADRSRAEIFESCFSKGV
jgi:hypothetical protein